MDAEGVTEAVLDLIAAGEVTLGRSLAPAHIVSIKHADGPTGIPLLRRDGTNPENASTITRGPGWVVVADGTFVSPTAGPITEHAIRAYLTFYDDGSEDLSPIACWVQGLGPGSPELDGWCP